MQRSGRFSPYVVLDRVVEEQDPLLDPVTRLVHHGHVRLLVRRELDDKVHPDLGVCRSAVRDGLNHPTGRVIAAAGVELESIANYKPKRSWLWTAASR